MKKLPDLKTPPCVKHEDKYELDFKLQPPKFPRLPSADFSLAFRPIFPELVVLTKHTLDSFKGHIYINMKHVPILSPIHEGT